MLKIIDVSLMASHLSTRKVVIIRLNFIQERQRTHNFLDPNKSHCRLFHKVHCKPIRSHLHLNWI